MKNSPKTLRKLAEAEEESGPLRNLAALFDAKNSLGLDLETFAIGGAIRPSAGGRQSAPRPDDG